MVRREVSAGGFGDIGSKLDSRISPARPAMTNRRSPNATPPSVVSVPELRRIHDFPSNDVRSVPLAPTAMNIPPPNVTSLSQSFVPDLAADHCRPLFE